MRWRVRFLAITGVFFPCSTPIAAAADVVGAPLSYTSRKLDPQGQTMQGWAFHAFDPDGYLLEVLAAAKPNNPGIPDPAPK